MYVCTDACMHVCMITAMFMYYPAGLLFRTDFADLAIYKAVCQ